MGEWFCDENVTTLSELGTLEYIVWTFADDASDPTHVADFSRFEDAQAACEAVNEKRAIWGNDPNRWDDPVFSIAKRACQEFDQRTDDYNARLCWIIVRAIREAVNAQNNSAETVRGVE